MTYTQTESTTRGSEFARPKQIFHAPELDWPRLYDILRLVETADGDQVNNADGFFEFAFGCLISGEYPEQHFTRKPACHATIARQLRVCAARRLFESE
jgi:hypothetical protein